MSLILLAGITPYGYGFFAIILLSILTAYVLLGLSDKNKKTGCFSVGFVGFLICFVLMFPFILSIRIIEEEITVATIAVVVFWVLVFGVVAYVGITKKQEAFNSGIFRVLRFLFFAIASGLFLVLFFGMAYFLYQCFFTHEKDNVPVWAVLLCIFFVATLILVVFGLLSKNTEADKKEKTTFYDLEAAKLKPESVVELDLANTKIDTFPLAILQFKNIQYLVLNNNNISEIPNEINQLQSLIGLDLSNNPISDLERNKIRKLFSKEVEIVF
ncbi:hypothetical protein [Flavobacterium sp.]|uniref:leucine-rich repeat domain-containing protein n=1 Tax=Flavobacterium sp. TaxID=239 RepID=UPI002C9BC22A|nr:hypothetical protein [Flavobacterium sp.]HSD06670.1 hypothetical protein [Flavobacterium sp.]